MLDGVASIEEIARNDLDFKQFLHELHVFIEAANCTTFLLSQLNTRNKFHPEHTVVDGLFELKDYLVGLRSVREIVIRKFRGTGYLRGRHSFEINQKGIVVYPRTEAILNSVNLVAPEDRRVVSTGVASLDQMIHGGLLSGSTTLLLGGSGTGKTLLGLNFLEAGARVGENGLHFGFYEFPPRLVAKANGIGLDFANQVKDGPYRNCLAAAFGK